MHFILEERRKELVGNIKLSSVTAENNWVFCPVACDFVWCLRRLGSSVSPGDSECLGCLWGAGVAPGRLGEGLWFNLRSRWERFLAPSPESQNQNFPAQRDASLLPFHGWGN